MRAFLIAAAIVAGLCTVVTAFPPFLPAHNRSSIAPLDATHPGSPAPWESSPSGRPTHWDTIHSGPPTPWQTTPILISAIGKNKTGHATRVNITDTSAAPETTTLAGVEPNIQTDDWPGHAPPSFSFSAPSTLDTDGFTRPLPCEDFPSSMFPGRPHTTTCGASTATEGSVDETKLATVTGSPGFSTILSPSSLTETETETESFTGPYEYSSIVPISTTNFPTDFPVTASLPAVTDTFQTDASIAEPTSTITDLETVTVTITSSSDDLVLTATATDNLGSLSVSTEPSFTSTFTQIVTLSDESLPASLPSSSAILPGLTFSSDGPIQITATNPLSSDLSRASGFGTATSGSPTESTSTLQFTNSTVSTGIISEPPDATTEPASSSASPIDSALSKITSIISDAASVIATKGTDTLIPVSVFISNSSISTTLVSSTLPQTTDAFGSVVVSISSDISAGIPLVPTSSEIVSIISSGPTLSSSDAIPSSDSLTVSTATESETDSPLSRTGTTLFTIVTTTATITGDSTPIPILTFTVSPLPLAGTDNLKAFVRTTLSTSTATDDPFGALLASISSALATGAPVESIISEVDSIISAGTAPAPSPSTRLPKPNFNDDRGARPGMALRDESSTPTTDGDGSVCACSIIPGQNKLCTRDCECCMDWEEETCCCFTELVDIALAPLGGVGFCSTSCCRAD